MFCHLFMVHSVCMCVCVCVTTLHRGGEIVAVQTLLYYCGIDTISDLMDITGLTSGLIPRQTDSFIDQRGGATVYHTISCVSCLLIIIAGNGLTDKI